MALKGLIKTKHLYLHRVVIILKTKSEIIVLLVCVGTFRHFVDVVMIRLILFQVMMGEHRFWISMRDMGMMRIVNKGMWRNWSRVMNVKTMMMLKP